MTKFKLLLSSALMVGFFANPSLAQNVDAADPEALAAVITEIGYPATLQSDESGPYLELDTGDGVSYVNFFDCTEGKDCKAIEFMVAYDLENGTTAEVMDEWNGSHSFPGAYMDSDNDPSIRFYLNLSGGGVTRENFETVLNYWAGSIAEFKSYMNI